MIKLTRLNQEVFFLNCDIIEQIEEVPHTVIRTVNDHTYVVTEKAEDIINEIIKFRSQYMQLPLRIKEGN